MGGHDEIILRRKRIAECEARTHDLWIMRPTLYQLSQFRLDEIVIQPAKLQALVAQLASAFGC
jgi:hypothetical protein